MVLRSKQAKVLSHHQTESSAWTRQTVREEGAASSLWARCLILISTLEGWMGRQPSEAGWFSAALPGCYGYEGISLLAVPSHSNQC